MFISTIHSLNNLQSLVDAGIDAIIVGIPYFSIRHCLQVDKEKLVTLKETCSKLGIKLYINFLRMCSEFDIDSAKDWLYFFKKFDIDGIYYADEGILYLAQELQIEDKLIYQPETLITSSIDVDFYLSQGIQTVSLAHELSLDEIRLITKKYNNVEILVNGYFSILYSRRYLITNYLDAIKSESIRKYHRYDLIEQTRKQRMPVFEDDAGTHIFSEQPISSFLQFDELKKMGINRFRIDSIFFDDTYTINVLNAYKTGQLFSCGSDHWYYEKTIKAKEDNNE